MTLPKGGIGSIIYKSIGYFHTVILLKAILLGLHGINASRLFICIESTCDLTNNNQPYFMLISSNNDDDDHNDDNDDDGDNNNHHQLLFYINISSKITV